MVGTEGARLLGAREVAQRLGVALRTAQAWMRVGRLPAIALADKTWRVREGALERWIQNREAATVYRG